MAIQLSKVLPNGVTVTYHRVTSVSSDFEAGKAQISVYSWADQTYYAAKKDAVSQQNVDISTFLSMVPHAATKPTFGAHMVFLIEQYLLTQPDFMGGVQI